MCEDIYVGKTNQKFKKILDRHFSDLIRHYQKRTEIRLI